VFLRSSRNEFPVTKQVSSSTELLDVVHRVPAELLDVVHRVLRDGDDDEHDDAGDVTGGISATSDVTAEVVYRYTQGTLAQLTWHVESVVRECGLAEELQSLARVPVLVAPDGVDAHAALAAYATAPKTDYRAAYLMRCYGTNMRIADHEAMQREINVEATQRVSPDSSPLPGEAGVSPLAASFSLAGFKLEDGSNTAGSLDGSADDCDTDSPPFSAEIVATHSLGFDRGQSDGQSPGGRSVVSRRSSTLSRGSTRSRGSGQRASPRSRASMIIRSPCSAGRRSDLSLSSSTQGTSSLASTRRLSSNSVADSPVGDLPIPSPLGDVAENGSVDVDPAEPWSVVPAEPEAWVRGGFGRRGSVVPAEPVVRDGNR